MAWGRADTYHNEDGTLRDFPWLTADDLGAAREYVFHRNGKQVKNHPQNRENEIFCSYESRAKNQNGFGIRASFYMRRTPRLQEFFGRLFQGSRYNQHIKFIEWPDRINCVICDGIYISEAHAWMTKEEFAKFMARIVPFDEIEEKYYGI